MGMRLSFRIEEDGSKEIALECDDRLPSEDIIPWTETFRQLSASVVSSDNRSTFQNIVNEQMRKR